MAAEKVPILNIPPHAGRETSLTSTLTQARYQDIEEDKELNRIFQREADMKQKKKEDAKREAAYREIETEQEWRERTVERQSELLKEMKALEVACLFIINLHSSFGVPVAEYGGRAYKIQDPRHTGEGFHAAPG